MAVYGNGANSSQNNNGNAGNANGQVYLGVTPPISAAPPTERHLQITESLMAELKARNQFESPEEARLREVVLSKLNTIVKDFVYRVAKMKRLSETTAKEAGGKIFTFGSYRLGVHGPGADIDTLAVAPRHVDRDDFFNVLEPMLKERPEVENLAGVPEAWVPIITMKFSGVDIDLLFARLADFPSIPDDLDLRDNAILKGTDDRCQRSLNGSRVTDEILRLVPNVLVFRDALRTVKLWAKRRAIYSNVMGFLGGVAWAMLVARICQLYPNECAGGIISKFFIILQQWNWPTPILLKPIEDAGPLRVRVWNPATYPSDKAHRMPIITPAYPAMCSTHNVSFSTQAVMTKEFKRAADIVDKIVVKSASWSELFAPHDFFQRYRYYLQITASSTDPEVQLKWSGTVESKIRLLVKQLEYVETLSLAHPFVEGFDRTNFCVTVPETHTVMQGEIPPEIGARTPEEYAEREGVLKVYTTSFFIGLLIEAKDPNAKGARKLDIAYPTAEFTKLVKQWERFDEAKMGIIVRHVKASALPFYCKPATASKKSLKRSKPTASVASPTTAYSETIMDVSPAKRLRASPANYETAGPETPTDADELSATSMGANNTTSDTAHRSVSAATSTNGSSNNTSSGSDPSIPGLGATLGASSSMSHLSEVLSAERALPQTPQTESATVAMGNLSTASAAGTPTNETLPMLATSIMPGKDALQPSNTLPGSSIPNASSLNDAAAGQLAGAEIGQATS